MDELESGYPKELLKVEEVDKKINIVLDATMFDTYQLCPTKFHYRFNLNRAAATKAPALDRGTLVHHGMEAYYLALQNEIKFDERIHLLKQAIIRATAESDLAEEECHRIIAVTIENVIRWKEQDEKFDIIAVETPFSYLLFENESVRIIMIGKIDLLVNYYDGRTSYEKLVIDHKSYERSFPLKRLVNQFCNYTFAVDTTMLWVNRVGFQTSLKPADKHVRVPLMYDPYILDQWKENTIRVCMDYLECVGTQVWPMNLTSCDKFNRLCEYYDVCDTSGTEGKIWKLSAVYHEAEKWDVSAALGKSAAAKIIDIEKSTHE